MTLGRPGDHSRLGASLAKHRHFLGFNIVEMFYTNICLSVWMFKTFSWCGQQTVLRKSSKCQNLWLLMSFPVQQRSTYFTSYLIFDHCFVQENNHLKESNEEMSTQILNNSVQIGRSLLHRGTTKSESFAAELETSSKDDVSIMRVILGVWPRAQSREKTWWKACFYSLQCFYSLYNVSAILCSIFMCILVHFACMHKMPCRFGFKYERGSASSKTHVDIIINLFVKIVGKWF